LGPAKSDRRRGRILSQSLNNGRRGHKISDSPVHIADILEYLADSESIHGFPTRETAGRAGTSFFHFGRWAASASPLKCRMIGFVALPGIQR